MEALVSRSIEALRRNGDCQLTQLLQSNVCFGIYIVTQHHEVHEALNNYLSRPVKLLSTIIDVKYEET